MKNFEDVIELERARMHKEQRERDEQYENLGAEEFAALVASVENFRGNHKNMAALERLERLQKLAVLLHIGGADVLWQEAKEPKCTERNGYVRIEMDARAFLTDHQFHAFQEAVSLADDMFFASVCTDDLRGRIRNSDKLNKDDLLDNLMSCFHIRVTFSVHNIWEE